MPRVSITKDEFITKMIEKYGEYDFSTLIFKPSKTSVECNKCGNVNTKTALRHIDCTCSKCYSNMSQRSNNDEFIKKTETKFGSGKYKYDKLNYINAKTSVILYCEEHGDYFDIIPNKFLCSNGCNVCNRNDAYTNSEFIKKCEKNYPGLFDYDSTEYVNQKTKVIVRCKHGNHDWIVDPKTLIKGASKCGICSGKLKRTTEQFIELAISKFANMYTYDNVNYKNSEVYVKITCNIHGDFEQTPKAHLSGRGCPKCGKYGYQPSQPGYFYVQKLTLDEEVLYKYGITGDLERRMLEQSRYSVYKHEFLYSKLFEDGKKPLLLEKFIKTYIPSGIVTSGELSSGFSETFSTEHLDAVMEIVNNFE